LTDRPTGNPHPEDSQRQINDLYTLVAVADACTPDGIEIGEGLFRDSLLGGFSRGRQFLNAITCSDKHVSVFREVRFVAERAVPRNNLGVIVGKPKVIQVGTERISIVKSAFRQEIKH
jgi:hypothetical protein